MPLSNPCISGKKHWSACSLEAVAVLGLAAAAARPGFVAPVAFQFFQAAFVTFSTALAAVPVGAAPAAAAAAAFPVSSQRTR